MEMNEDDQVAAETEAALKDWKEAFEEARKYIEEIEKCTSSSALPRLNAMAQDSLSAMRSAQLRLDLLAPQQPSQQQSESCLCTLQLWQNQHSQMHSKLLSANWKAKANIQKALKEERELLFGGGEESTIRRRNLETKAGMTAAAESITESLRRTRQLMVQEIERGAATLTTLDQSSSTLKKAENEYKGHSKLLMGSRRLLKVLQRQDVLDRHITFSLFILDIIDEIMYSFLVKRSTGSMVPAMTCPFCFDRIILTIGFLLFCIVVLYITSKRIGLLSLQRKLFDSFRKHNSGMYLESEYPKHLYHVNDNIKTVGPSEREDHKDNLLVKPFTEVGIHRKPSLSLRTSYGVCILQDIQDESFTCKNINYSPLLQRLLETWNDG